MTGMAEQPADEPDLAAVTRALDLRVPADLAAGVLAGHRALREMAALLRRAGTEAPDA